MNPKLFSFLAVGIFMASNVDAKENSVVRKPAADEVLCGKADHVEGSLERGVLFGLQPEGWTYGLSVRTKDPLLVSLIVAGRSGRVCLRTDSTAGDGSVAHPYLLTWLGIDWGQAK